MPVGLKRRRPQIYRRRRRRILWHATPLRRSRIFNRLFSSVTWCGLQRRMTWHEEPEQQQQQHRWVAFPSIRQRLTAVPFRVSHLSGCLRRRPRLIMSDLLLAFIWMRIYAEKRRDGKFQALPTLSARGDQDDRSPNFIELLASTPQSPSQCMAYSRRLLSRRTDVLCRDEFGAYLTPIRSQLVPLSLYCK